MDANLRQRKSLDKGASRTRPVIKLLRSNSSTSLNSNFQCNTITIAQAENFDQIESIIRGEEPSKIEDQPQILVNTISIDGDKDQEKVEKPNTEFKVPINHRPDSMVFKKGKMFEGKTFMPIQPMVSTGIILDFNTVRDKKQALEDWQKQMETCFTMKTF